MATSAGRVVCPRCGANNFDTVSACWKCSAPLSSAPPAPHTGYTPSPIANPISVQTPPSFGGPQPPPAAEAFAYRAAAAVQQAGDTARANRAAFWLGITMPYFGFPIGLAFMMCDDRRRQEVGRLCIIWSLVSGVFHLLLMFVSLLGMREWMMMFLGAAKTGLNSRGGGLGGGLGGDLGQ
jgi:hypothetical protein